jgi:alpha-1,2-mannosyltransferase
MKRLIELFRAAPVRLGLWMFLPMLLFGLLGKLLEDQLAGGKTPGNPSSLHAVKWMLITFFNPSPADDSWMPMRVALEVTRGPRASELFQAVFFERNIKFQYPPTSLLPLEPLAKLGLLDARVLNGLNSLVLVLNAAAIAALAYLVFDPRRAPGKTPALDRRWVVILAVAGALLFYPVVQAHTLGQIQTWIDLFFGAACLFWLTGRNTLAGIAIGLACALKPQFGLLLPWALVWRRWDFAIGLVACVLPIGLLSLARYGLANHLSYLEVLSHLSRHGESFQFNQSMNGLLNRWLFNGCNICPPWVPTALPPFHPVVYYSTTAVTIVLLGVAFLPALLRRREQPKILDFGIATLCFTMASPVAWYHHYGIMVPLFVLAFRSLLDEPDARSRRIWIAVLGVSWVLSSNYLAFFNLLANTRLNPLQSHLFVGALLLLTVLVRQAKRAAFQLATSVERPAVLPAIGAPHANFAVLEEKITIVERGENSREKPTRPATTPFGTPAARGFWVETGRKGSA